MAGSADNVTEAMYLFVNVDFSITKPQIRRVLESISVATVLREKRHIGATLHCRHLGHLSFIIIWLLPFVISNWLSRLHACSL